MTWWFVGAAGASAPAVGRGGAELAGLPVCAIDGMTQVTTPIVYSSPAGKRGLHQRRGVLEAAVALALAQQAGNQVPDLAAGTARSQVSWWSKQAQAGMGAQQFPVPISFAQRSPLSVAPSM